ncbi:MAG: GNAT family N-acetyltransferase [Lachnospiraceae bacterium]|nr:GNAT family N-acetyltransferase [Lachnospiraceae bacterium]
MEIYHVTKESPEWLFKAYDYVRTDAFCFGQNIPIETEFSHDAPREDLQAVVLVEDHKPVAGCRIAFPAKGVGKIERVCVIREKQKSGYGSILIEDAEKWILESGVKHIVISSQDRAAGFYNKLGYVTNYEVSPSVYERPREKKPDEEKKEKRINLGFSCVLVEKYLPDGEDEKRE